MRIHAPAVSLLLAAPALRPVCPTPTGAAGWQSGLGVNYNFPGCQEPDAFTPLSITGIGIDGDINSGFSQWSYADQSQNPSGVTFYLASGNGPYVVCAAKVNNPGQPGLDPGKAADTTVAVYSGTAIVAWVVTTFYIGSISSTGGYACYDQSANNYHTFVQQVMVHEIGHSMWLNDQSCDSTQQCCGQTAGQSVMNYQCGTNDAGNNLPAPALGLPSCDNASVQ